MENDLFLQQAKFQRKAAVFMMIFTLPKKNILLTMMHLRVFHISMILTQDQDTLV